MLAYHSMLLGMAMTRVLLGLVPAPGKTHREIFEDFMEHTRNAGEHVMKILDLEGLEPPP
jgi:hypothetical protein